MNTIPPGFVVLPSPPKKYRQRATVTTEEGSPYLRASTGNSQRRIAQSPPEEDPMVAYDPHSDLTLMRNPHGDHYWLGPGSAQSLTKKERERIYSVKHEREEGKHKAYKDRSSPRKAGATKQRLFVSPNRGRRSRSRRSRSQRSHSGKRSRPTHERGRRHHYSPKSSDGDHENIRRIRAKGSTSPLPASISPTQPFVVHGA